MLLCSLLSTCWVSTNLERFACVGSALGETGRTIYSSSDHALRDFLPSVLLLPFPLTQLCASPTAEESTRMAHSSNVERTLRHSSCLYHLRQSWFPNTYIHATGALPCSPPRSPTMSLSLILSLKPYRRCFDVRYLASSEVWEKREEDKAPGSSVGMWSAEARFWKGEKEIHANCFIVYRRRKRTPVITELGEDSVCTVVRSL